MSVVRTPIAYELGGKTFRGQLVRDASQDGPCPGVLVFPEAFGLGEHALQRAERLAQLGYVALAVDLHGDATLHPDLPSVVPAIRALHADRAQWRAQMRAAFDALARQPQVDGERIAAIGFCFGGACCFELARSAAPLVAICTFHAGLLPELDGDAGRICARVLICHGAADPLVKKEALEAVTAELGRDQVDWQLVTYGNTAHSFTDPQADARNIPGIRYQADADHRSWVAMRGLLEEVFA